LKYFYSSILLIGYFHSLDILLNLSEVSQIINNLLLLPSATITSILRIAIETTFAFLILTIIMSFISTQNYLIIYNYSVHFWVSLRLNWHVRVNLTADHILIAFGKISLCNVSSLSRESLFSLLTLDFSFLAWTLPSLTISIHAVSKYC